VIKRLHWE